MNKIIATSILVLMLLIPLTGCQHHQVRQETYESKVAGNQTDKNVKMKYWLEQDKASVQLEFDEKGIPFDIKLTPIQYTYLGKYQLSGTLAEGSISIKLLSGDGKKVYEQINYQQGKIKANVHFDLYGGEYILRIDFKNAKRGKIKFKFGTQQI